MALKPLFSTADNAPATGRALVDKKFIVTGDVTMLTRQSPAAIVPPSYAYYHGVVAESATRWLHVFGQIGLKPGGSLAGDTEVRMKACWPHISLIWKTPE